MTKTAEFTLLGKLGKSAEMTEVQSVEEKELLKLTAMWGQVNAFGTNEIDEFQVVRENGEKQGIFKSWAIPIIPFLTAGRVDVLADLIPSIRTHAKEGKTFEQSLKTLAGEFSIAREAQLILNCWSTFCLAKPLAFAQHLEQARLESWQIDRRLTEVFNQEPLSDDTGQRINQLVNRLTISLGLMSPFYNLEALVGDPKGFEWNPVRVAQNQKPDFTPSGNLDVQALFLPSAFQDQITAEQLDWNGLSWNEIMVTTRRMLSENSPERQIALRLSKQIGTSPAHLVFGFNALEFIPVRVGGKKRDFSKSEAIERLREMRTDDLDGESSLLIEMAGKANAKIRFLNWLPLIEGENNFKGLEWTYASICDTSAQLREVLLAHPEVWDGDFAKIFSNQLVSQINNLDAESAKARFLLHLILVENRLKQEFVPTEDKSWKLRTIKEILKIRESEAIRNLGDGLKPIGVIGGKSLGLEMLIASGEDFNIPPGIEITCEFVESFLKNNARVWEKIIELEFAHDPDIKRALSEEIQVNIRNASFPKELIQRIQGALKKVSGNPEQKFAVRSSSLDEDNPDLLALNGAGVQKTELNVGIEDLETAVKECVASFFGPKQIAFREATKLSTLPQFAILIQPMIDGVGGIAFSKDFLPGEGRCTIDVAEKPWLIADGSKEFTEFTFENGSFKTRKGNSEVIPKEKVVEIKSILERIENLTGEEIDMEWVIDQGGKIWVLQARTLPKPKFRTEQRTASVDIIVQENQPISTIRELLEMTEGNVNIVLCGNRDLDAFQGEIFSIIARFGKRIAEVTLDEPVPSTSHFANICGGIGITISVDKKGVKHD